LRLPRETLVLDSGAPRHALALSPLDGGAAIDDSSGLPRWGVETRYAAIPAPAEPAISSCDARHHADITSRLKTMPGAGRRAPPI
jgi:hypothetical protein